MTVNAIAIPLETLRAAAPPGEDPPGEGEEDPKGLFPPPLPEGEPEPEG